MRFTAVLVVLLSSLLSATAHGQDKSDPGTRLLVDDDGERARLMIAGKVQKAGSKYKDEGISVGVRVRWVTIPDAILESWLLDHTSFDNYSIGLEVGIDGPAGSRVVFGLDYTNLSMPSGNFRASKELPEEASFTEVDLHLIGIDANFLWRFKLHPRIGIIYGIGIGIGFLIGNITSIDVFPTCQAPVADCGHWRDVTKREQDIPSRVWPLVTAQAGLYFDPGAGVRIRIDGGWRGVFFVGMGVRKAF